MPHGTLPLALNSKGQMALRLEVNVPSDTQRRSVRLMER